MEVVTAKKEAKGILGNIRAPRLEDAGLEDCALSPKSIKQAFFKAANSIRSFVTDDEDGSCVQDPCPTDSKLDDSLIGISPAPDPPGPCGNKKGATGNGGLMGDEVCVGVKDATEDEGFDKLLGSEVPDDKKACVDGLEGLKIDGDEKNGVQKDEDDDKEEEEPILVEAFI
ncbi:hypothetical protein FRX31_018208 [Thalictrum thalictroides]|uniref:Uncharacterized protein n=1 Tax=Thalictrum thalictroides TaxID=46969 RepID=A0A7J6W566_THATH|nr:hypothetical protein FRX31_018208 [Thalictrum thalictroides]